MTNADRSRNGLPPISTPRPAPQPEQRVPPRQMGKTRFSTVAEVAATLRVSKMTIYRMVHSNELPGYKIGNTYRIPTQAVWAYIFGARIDFLSIKEDVAL